MSNEYKPWESWGMTEAEYWQRRYREMSEAEHSALERAEKAEAALHKIADACSNCRTFSDLQIMAGRAITEKSDLDDEARCETERLAARVKELEAVLHRDIDCAEEAAYALESMHFGLHVAAKSIEELEERLTLSACEKQELSNMEVHLLSKLAKIREAWEGVKTASATLSETWRMR